jgi:hypothetical protein
MSLLAELHARGVTTEDLEKAASVRLFEKAAAAEGVNLDDLDEDQVISLFEQFVSQPETSTKEASAMSDVVDLFEKTAAAEGLDLDAVSDEDLADLYNHYVENVLPEQIAELEGDSNEGDYEDDDGELDKEASAAIFEMFEKTAADEGIDLEEMSDEDLAELYDHYIENVLPEQLEEDDSEEKVADAQEKLAEAEILGRHMARAYADEMDKVASIKDLKERASSLKERAGEEIRRLRGKSTLKDRARRFGRSYMSALKGEEFKAGRKQYGGVLARAERRLTGGSGGRINRAAKSKMLRGALRTGGAYGAPAALLAGGAALMNKNSSAFDVEFDDDVLDALDLIESEFGEDVANDVAEDMAEKVAFEVPDAATIADKRYRKTRRRGLPIPEAAVDALGETGRAKAVRATTLLTGNVFKELRGKKGPGLLRAAYGKGHKKGLIFNREGKVDKTLVREARKILATRGAVGLAGLGAAGYAGKKALEKNSSDETSDLAIEMLLAAGYDI